MSQFGSMNKAAQIRLGLRCGKDRSWLNFQISVGLSIQFCCKNWVDRLSELLNVLVCFYVFKRALLYI
jgi:hypothetical protein